MRNVGFSKDCRKRKVRFVNGFLDMTKQLFSLIFINNDPVAVGCGLVDTTCPAHCIITSWIWSLNIVWDSKALLASIVPEAKMTFLTFSYHQYVEGKLHCLVLKFK